MPASVFALSLTQPGKFLRRQRRGDEGQRNGEAHRCRNEDPYAAVRYGRERRTAPARRDAQSRSIRVRLLEQQVQVDAIADSYREDGDR